MKPRERFLVFGAPQVREEEIEEVVKTLRSGWWGSGPRVAEFEVKFAEYKQIRYAVALNSCTAALHLSLLAAGVGPGDEVITTPVTFCATVNAIIHAGARPVLADVDPRTWNIDPAEVERRITPATRAILPVHLAGMPCEMAPLEALAKRRGLTLIEDCAHAIETEYQGRKAGSFGRFACFSFYVTKNVATGEGGMVLTSDEAAAARIKVLGLHGMSKDAWKRWSDSGYRHYDVTEVGFKYNMMDIQAALGLHQLSRVEANWVRRREIWHRYHQAFASLPVQLPADAPAGSRHAYHLFAMLVDERTGGVSRDAFLSRMTDRKIGVGVHYRSLPELSVYRQRFGWRAEDWPVGRRVGEQTVSLPLSAALTDGDVEDVIEAVNEIFASATHR